MSGALSIPGAVRDGLLAYWLASYQGHPDWEDLMQTARIVAWRAGTRVPNLAYISAAVKSAARDFLKSESASRPRGFGIEPRPPLGSLEKVGELPPAPDPAGGIVDHLLLEQFLLELSPSEEKTARLWLQGYSQQEVADRLGCCRPTVFRRLQRALARFCDRHFPDARPDVARVAPPGGRRGQDPRCHAHIRNRTHCPAGHPYADDNLIIRADGARTCRACRLAWVKRQTEERQAARAAAGAP